MGYLPIRRRIYNILGLMCIRAQCALDMKKTNWLLAVRGGGFGIQKIRFARCDSAHIIVNVDISIH